MSTELRCNCCKDVYKIVNDTQECAKCKPIEMAFRRVQDGLIADALTKSEELRQAFFLKNGIKIPGPDASPPGEASASATSHAKAASGSGNGKG